MFQREKICRFCTLMKTWMHLIFLVKKKTCEELPVHVFSNLALIIPLCMENGYYDAAALLDNWYFALDIDRVDIPVTWGILTPAVLLVFFIIGQLELARDCSVRLYQHALSMCTGLLGFICLSPPLPSGLDRASCPTFHHPLLLATVGPLPRINSSCRGAVSSLSLISLRWSLSQQPPDKPQDPPIR